jgi:hypothetical protein
VNRYFLARRGEETKGKQHRYLAKSSLNLLATLFIQIAYVILFFSLLQEAQACDIPWYDPNWLYRMPITIVPVTSVADYQLKVTITPETFDYSKAEDNGEDIRFTGSDGTTLQDFWIERWNNNGTSVVWVEVKDSGSNRIYIYYGNSEADSASNGFETFEKRGFDDFEIYDVGPLSGQRPAGKPWTEYQDNPVLNTTSKDGFSSVLRVGDTYHMYYSYGDVRHATSPDGENWTVDIGNNPVVTDAGVPMVWRENSTWYMLYRAGSPLAVNLATSTDGVSWTKYEGNPILTERGDSIEAWGIIKVDSTYYMFYSNFAGTAREIGLATSTDLINWTKDVNNPIFTGGRFCGSIFKYDSYYYFLVPHYTSGCNYAQIELYRDANPTFYPESREFMGIAIQYGEGGAWNAGDQDTPIILTDDIYRNSYECTNGQLWAYYAGSPDGSVYWYTGLTIEEDIESALQKSNGAFFLWSSDNCITTVVDTPTRGGIRAVCLTDANYSGCSQLTPTFKPQASTGAVGIWMRRNSAVGYYGIYLYDEETFVAKVGFSQNGYFNYWDGSFHDTNTGYSINTWYLIDLEFNTNTDKYNFVVCDANSNKIVKRNDIPFGNPSGAIEKIVVYRSSNMEGDGYIDDFMFRKHTSPEPRAIIKMFADMDIDSDVDFADFSAFAHYWMNRGCAEPNWCNGADFDFTTVVDFADLDVIAEDWLVGVE